VIKQRVKQVEPVCNGKSLDVKWALIMSEFVSLTSELNLIRFLKNILDDFENVAEQCQVVNGSANHSGRNAQAFDGTSFACHIGLYSIMVGVSAVDKNIKT
jgi:hypothetical protein